MNKQRNSRSIILIITIFAFMYLLNGFSVFAATENSGSIEIKYTRDTQAISGAEICIYKVTDDIDIEKTNAKDFLKTLNDRPYQSIITDEDGYCKCDTELGIYLVCQTGRNRIATKYELFDPYFVGVPSYLDGQTLYTVETFPKTVPIPEQPSEPEPSSEPEQPSYPQTPPDTVPTSDQTVYIPIVCISIVSFFLVVVTTKKKTDK